ncbi:uncharacterized protein J8A68_005135 [[Candida] subhashii]|uniref:RRM domain-containing protein n=1 Tax=[Candida] subhashii TaxID=561895 RepID=A0A8J5QIC0_9ASCO|nr:uncharacterized protein J8A68_005135 [[Candida] subhashii]KAG7661343.1 hypothetical protein J8A68_005135 [[Candida] subhashii]
MHSLTPLDLAYSQSMIPSNLLINSPYYTPPPSTRYLTHPNSSIHQVYQDSPNSSPSSSGSRLRKQSNRSSHTDVSSLPFLAPLNNTTLTSVNSSSSLLNYNTDQLNISRTIILKNISEAVTLQELLNEIDFGPIEYCKMFSKATPKGILATDPDVSNTLQVCHISFINSKISVMFHLKYVKSATNLNRLKEALKDSKYLKIQLHEGHNFNKGCTPNSSKPSNNQDFVKLKTLNYILDYNATRCLIVKFTIKDNLPEGIDSETRLEHIMQFIKNQCGKFGEVEDFKINLKSEPEEGETRIHGKILVHFSSIDSAIKGYENYNRRIQQDLIRLKDNEEGKPKKTSNEEDKATKKSNGDGKTTRKNKEGKAGRKNNSKDINEVHAKYDIKFIYVNFHKDRCDRTYVDGQHGPRPKDISPDSTSSRSANRINSSTLKRTSEEPSPAHSMKAESLANSTDIDQFIDGQTQNGLSIIDPISPNSSIVGDTSFESIPSDLNELDDDRNLSNRDLHSVVSSQITPTLMQLPHRPLQYHHPMSMSMPMAPPNTASSFVGNYPANPDPANIGNRTIYLGNLHSNTTIEEIANNVRAGGIVESIKYRPDKKVCFITFVDPNVALKFYLSHQAMHQLIIHGYDITVGWAKQHSGPLYRDIALAVTAGASRNVYIGIKVIKDPEERTKVKPRLPDEDELRNDFSKFGGMEQINFYHNKDCGFLNFLNIADAITVVEIFDCVPEDGRYQLRKLFKGIHTPEELDAFYYKYKDFKISFAKDRCGNPPKFSFKKRINGAAGSTYQQYQSQIHTPHSGSRASSTRGYEEYHKQTRMSETESYMEQTINEETAMVFGIINNQEREKEEQEARRKKEDEAQKEATQEAKDEVDADIGEVSEQVAGLNIENNNGHDYDGDADSEEDGADEDDDDDVSIIIESDSSLTEKSDVSKKSFSKKKNSKKPIYDKTRYQKVYHKRFHQSDSSLPMRNSLGSSSTLSLNSNFFNFNQPSGYSTPSAYGQPQPFYYVQTQLSHSSSSKATYYPPPQFYSVPAPQYYGIQEAYGGQARYVHNGGSPRTHHGTRKSNITSGSQLMAQYLAKSQNEDMFYTSTILPNNVEIDVDEDFDESFQEPPTANIPLSNRRTSRK